MFYLDLRNKMKLILTLMVYNCGIYQLKLNVSLQNSKHVNQHGVSLQYELLVLNLPNIQIRGFCAWSIPFLIKILLPFN
jgi:hypothetical protein